MIVNLQRKIKLNTKPIKEYATRLSTEITEARRKDFSIAFVSDRRMKELNAFFRGKTVTTDVLSFPHEPDEFESTSTHDNITPEGVTLAYLGDIVISVEQAQKQAGENGLILENEIKQLILHGLLHLCGYDHEADSGEMNKRELELRRELGI